MAFARVHVPALMLSLLLPAGAFAQGQPAATTPAAATPPLATPPAAATPTTPSDGTTPAPADGTTTPPKPKVDATGYGYSDTPPPRRTGGAAPRARRVAARPAGPVATLPGFEMRGDGGSRLFVQLTQSVTVEEKRAAGTVTYVLKGAHVLKHNNQNALVTVHFNTPVSRARLVPQGGDLLFVVEMRANAQPTWKLEPAKDNSAVLTIDFAKGDFLGSGPAAPQPEPNADSTSDTTDTTTARPISPRKPGASSRVKRR
jgi:hypothetical protein